MNSIFLHDLLHDSKICVYELYDAWAREKNKVQIRKKKSVKLTLQMDEKKSAKRKFDKGSFEKVDSASRLFSLFLYKWTRVDTRSNS